MEAPSSNPSLTLCICTIDRVDILRRCLESIVSGSEQPDAVFVSDDSAAGDEAAALCREFPIVTYVKGPRKGLCANRNSVIRHTSTTHVSLLDDDSVLSENFVKCAREVIVGCPSNVIITGIVNEADVKTIPNNPSFLGHFQKIPTGRFENVNLNCNVFPRLAFDYAVFDEAIAYGYEDMDLCSHLLSVGFEIRFEACLQNTHLPPKRTSSGQKERFLRAERARFYTSVKRYMLWNQNYLALMAYLVWAPVHRALHAIRVGFWFDLKHCIPDMAAAVQGGLREKTKLKQLTVESSHVRFRSHS